MKTWEHMRLIVKEKKKAQGIQQKYLAGQCGFDEKTFSMIVNGRKPITDGDIEKFCRGMGVSPNDLIKVAPAP